MQLESKQERETEVFHDSLEEPPEKEDTINTKLAEQACQTEIEEKEEAPRPVDT